MNNLYIVYRVYTDNKKLDSSLLNYFIDVALYDPLLMVVLKTIL